VTSLLFVGAMATILLVYFRFVFGYFMRNCERQADLYALQLVGNSRGLVSSLEKIAVHSGHSHDRPSWHHFSIRQRIDFLKKCEADRRWITSHDNKLRRSIAIFVLGLLSLGYLGYNMDFIEMGKTLNSRLIEKVLLKEIEANPTNATLYFTLGTIYYEDEAFVYSIAAYEKSISMAPNNPEALNNLAWIYATSSVSALRSPVQALVYAQKAAALKPAPHVLDTLAESYYVNGHYESQLRKFEEALDKER